MSEIVLDDDVVEMPNEPGTDQPNRKRYLGGSDAAAIMGLGAYSKTPYSVWLAKRGEAIEVSDPDKEKFFRRRKRFEPLIVEMLREEFDAEIVAVNKRYTLKSLPYIAAEIDFEWRDPETGLIEGGEIKTVSPFAFGEKHGWGEPGSDEVPIHYAAQVVHGQGIRGYRKTIVAALVGFDTMLFYQVNRDQELIDKMRKACVDFWNVNVIGGKMPEALTLEDAKRQVTRTILGRPVMLDAERKTLLDEIKAARELQKLGKEREEEYMFKFLDWVAKAWNVENAEELPNDNALLMFGDPPQLIGKLPHTRGAALDQKRLRLDKPEITRAYTKEFWYRKLTWIKPKD